MRRFLKTTITVLALAVAMLLPVAAVGQNGGGGGTEDATPSTEATGSMEDTGSMEATGSEEATGESLPFTEESTDTTDMEDEESLPYTGGGEIALAFASVAGAAGYALRRLARR